MKKEAKDVGHEVLPDFEGVEAAARTCEYPSRVREGRIPFESFSRLTNRSGADTLR